MAKRIRLEPLNGWKPNYRSGQFLTFLFDSPSGSKRRSYSISSCVELGEPIEITVKRMANGEFSRPLNDKLKVGEVLYSTGIGGFFTLPEQPDSVEYLFIAAGSGITPCFPLIRLLLNSYNARVRLIYSNKSPKLALFQNDILALVDAHPGKFHVDFLFSEEINLRKRRLSKPLLSELLAESKSSARPIRAYLCGPFEFMQMCRIVLNTFDRLQIVQENFESFPPSFTATPPDRDKHTVHVTIQGRQYDLAVQFPLSITKSAAQLGIQLPYSCEAGRCGSCAATCVRGNIWMAYNEVLTDAEVKKGRILACQAFPVGGDAEIHFD